ncbi:MAG: response regulator [Candidatus Helarchaeota archaeon]
MKENESATKEKLQPFKEIWRHIPTGKKKNELDTLSGWVKNVIKKVDGESGKILVVDDEIEVVNSLKMILEHQGYIVDTAANGIDALEKLSRDDFDLILTDIRMPAMDGMELCEIIKNHPQLNRIPIILFSGYYETFESLADYFLAKPIDAETLLRVIQKIFRKYQIAREVNKIGEISRRAKKIQLISLTSIQNLSELRKILDFIWIFQPNYIPLFEMSHRAKMSIDNLRELLYLLEEKDTALIVADSPVLRSLLKSEIAYLGGNPARIFDSIENVKRSFKLEI